MRSRLAIVGRLLPYLRPHRARLSLYLGLTILVAGVELLAPWPMKILVDSVLQNHPLPRAVTALPVVPPLDDKITLLIATVLAMIVLKLIIGGLKIFNSYLSVTVRQRLVLALKSDLFYHLQRQSFAFYDTRRVGDLIYRIENDVWGIDELLLTVMPLVVASITLTGMLWIVAYLNWHLALVAVIVTPLFYATYGFYSKHFDRRVEEIQRLEGESTSIVQEVLSGLRVVKAFTREDYEQSRFVRQGESASKARITLTNQQVSYSMMVGLITTAGTALVLGVGAYQILQGSLTLGELLVILAYLGSVYGPLESISGAATYMHAYVAKMRRIFEILDTEPDIKDRPGAITIGRVKGQVVFDGVSFAYANRGPVLHDISFAVRQGQAIAIAGPTGAGKTTIVSLVPRFYDPSAGRILIDGRDIRDLQLKSLRQQISIVLQEPILFLGTIRENISYGKPSAGYQEIVHAAKLANAHDFIVRLPQGYDTQVGERGAMLSGGEKQRISIARAFLKDAPILILDEPTSSVDYQTEAVILEALERLMHGRTTFIIAHRLSTIRTANQILVVRDGRIVEAGTHGELVVAGGLYTELHSSATRSRGAHPQGDLHEPRRP